MGCPQCQSPMGWDLFRRFWFCVCGYATRDYPPPARDFD